MTEALLQPLAERQGCNGALEVTAHACTLLDDTYCQALERLSRGSPPCYPSCTNDSCALDATLELSVQDEEAAGVERGEEGRGSQARPWRAGSGLRQAWCGGTLQPEAGAKQERVRQERLSAAAKQCVREVDGGLDEVVGLDAIKQVRGCRCMLRL